MSHRDGETAGLSSLSDVLAGLWGQAQARGTAPPDVDEFLLGHPDAGGADRLAVFLVDQRERWGAGLGKPAEWYLGLPSAAAVAADRGLVRELALGELETRRGLGEIVDPQDFARRFPDLAPDLSGQLHAADIARNAETGCVSQCPTLPAGLAGLEPDLSFRTGAGTGSGRMPRTTGQYQSPPTDDGMRADTLPARGGGEAVEAPELGEEVRYSILRRIGGGGMGVVYQAFDRGRGEVVALKTMRRIDPVALYRFKQEFRALSDLSHPNLVNLFELVAVGDLWFFTMELVPGLDFVCHVRGRPGEADASAGGTAGISPAQVARLRPALRQLTEGVLALHGAGKLHRDIKPTNVLVTAEGRVVLLDFGLTAELGRTGLHRVADDDNQVVGTVAYMAPEQAAGRALSRAGDWYSVGVMLFEALTGRLPFDGPHGELIRMKLLHDPPAPAAVAWGVPDDLNDLCVALLARDPAVRLCGAAVLARLGDETAAPGRVALTPEPPVLAAAANVVEGRCAAATIVGRERHAAALRQAFETMRAGRAVLLLVSGRSGSGKTTLIESFLAEAAEDDEAVVLAGRCYERESVPYKLLDSVIDALSRHLAALPEAEARRLIPADMPRLARMFPVLRRVSVVARVPRDESAPPDEQESRRRAIHALRELLARIGRERPLVVFIDDLQWGDPDNAGLLEDLLRGPDAPVLLLIGSYRTEDLEACPLLGLIREVTGAPGEGPELRELAVDPLSPSESRGLTLALLGRNDAAALADAFLVARESRGNPYFIAELVKHLQSGERIAREAEGVPAGQLDLEEMIWSRVGRLTGVARRLLEVVAVSGRPVGLTEACLAADLGPEGRAAAASLRAARLLRGTVGPSRDEVETYHDWVRETVVARLPAETLAGHHRRLAGVLEAAGQTDPETLALHYERGGQTCRAAELYAVAADRAAEAMAFAHAARLYRLALDRRAAVAAGRAGEAELELLTRLGDVLAAAGRGLRAAQVYREAAGSPAASAARSIELRRREATQLLISGHLSEGLAALNALPGRFCPATTGCLAGLAATLVRRAARVVTHPRYRFTPRDESQVSAESLARIDLCWSAAAALSIIDPAAGAAFQTRGLLQSLRAGEPYRVGRALALEACHVGLPGPQGTRRAEALLARAGRLDAGPNRPHLDAMTGLARVLIDLTAGRWRDAYGGLARAEQNLRDHCRGAAWELDTVHNFQFTALMYLGDLSAMRRLWPALMQEASDRGDLYAEATLGSIYMTLIRLADDEPHAARRDLDAAMARWPTEGFHVQHSGALRAHVAIDLYEGRPLAAWNRVCTAWPAYRRSMIGRVLLIRMQLADLRARAALAAADLSPDRLPLLDAAEESAREMEQAGVGWAEAHAVMIRAGVAARRCQFPDASRLFRDAAARFQALEMAVNAAVARRRAARFLSGHEAACLRADAVAELEALGVRRVDPFVAVYAPDVLGEPERDPSTDDRRVNVTATRT